LKEECLDDFALRFNLSLKEFFQFSNSIVISILGDGFMQASGTMAERVQTMFKSDHDTIFKGISLDKMSATKYMATFEDKQIDIQIGPVDTQVHPIGRFRQYLAEKGILDEYIEWFGDGRPKYVCPDMIKWPGLILEPNGDINLCGSFEAVIQDLLAVHKSELGWFVDNIEGIVSGDVATCKLLNYCYGHAQKR
jgi:hypothetical protein